VAGGYPALPDLDLDQIRRSLVAYRYWARELSLERIDPMEKNSVYRIIDVVGVSETSWEDAGRHAVETAAGSLHDLRVAEVTKMDMKVENGKVTEFRTRVALSFKYDK
jgi:dodecin